MPPSSPTNAISRNRALPLGLAPMLLTDDTTFQAASSMGPDRAVQAQSVKDTKRPLGYRNYGLAQVSQISGEEHAALLALQKKMAKEIHNTFQFRYWYNVRNNRPTSHS